MIDTKTLIAGLSPVDLHKLADQYLEVSNDLRAAAISKAAALFRENASLDHRRKLENIPWLVAGYQAGGMTTEAAIRAAATAAGVDDRCVLAWLRRDRQQVDRGKREAAKTSALDLASQGAGVREIAAKVHLPRSTVARLVRKAREEKQSAVRPAKSSTPGADAERPGGDWATAGTA